LTHGYLDKLHIRVQDLKGREVGAKNEGGLGTKRQMLEEEDEQS